MVDNRHMTIVPGDRDCVPALFRDSAPISGIASPVNASALLKVLRFGGGHIALACPEIGEKIDRLHTRG